VFYTNAVILGDQSNDLKADSITHCVLLKGPLNRHSGKPKPTQNLVFLIFNIQPYQFDYLNRVPWPIKENTRDQSHTLPQSNAKFPETCF
jgi:hypothetical protein